MEGSLEMKALTMVGGVLVLSLLSSPAISKAVDQPPMNDFNSAFYTCASGGAFEVSYDSATPSHATLTTSHNNTRYVLTRASAGPAIQFAKGAVRFRTTGQTALVQGTRVPLRDCRLKGK